ncbi:MAG TPA: hypothetical protein VJ888_05480, partial [Mobilitalea sp.]|nr:hypothetical protein [Mobilitalea sp.]
MVDKPILYLLVKMIAVIASLLIADYSKADMILWIISALSFACVFVLELLMYRLLHRKNIIVITIIASMAACFGVGMDILFPVFIILLLHLFDILIDRNMFYQIISVAMTLSVLALMPGKDTFILAMILTILLLFCREILNKLESYRKINERQNETINELSQKLIDMKGLIKTLKFTASLEERNRIAARIHDQIGHGIS